MKGEAVHVNCHQVVLKHVRQQASQERKGESSMMKCDGFLEIPALQLDAVKDSKDRFYSDTNQLCFLT